MKAFLKNTVFLLICMFALSLAATGLSESGGILDDSRFPDLHLRQALDLAYGNDKHEVNFGRTEINISNSEISDLTGMELFYNLQELDCSGNNLLTLNLHMDIKRQLSILNCEDNPLSVLNFADYDNLQILTCSGSQLTQLSLRNNNLTLKRLFLKNIGVDSLDLHGFPSLEEVSVTGGDITALDLSGCEQLKTLICENCTQLRSLDVSGCSNLEYISLNGCGFSSLSLSSLPSLGYLTCNENPMKSLSLSSCPLLDSVECHDCQLTSLTISGCNVLGELFCQNNQLTSLSGIPSLGFLDCSGNSISQLGSFPELTDLNCADNHLTSLSVPDGIMSLDCRNNLLSSLDTSHRVDLYNLDCSCNQLTSLQVTGCEELSLLSAHGNLLQELDIDGTAMVVEWVGDSFIDNLPVKTWNFDLTFDPSTLLRCGSEIIYDPAGQPVMNLPTFFLPLSLTTIQEDAFSGIAATAVLIPESVENIVGDPFSGSAVTDIYIYPDSPAEAFAARWANKYTFHYIEQGD